MADSTATTDTTNDDDQQLGTAGQKALKAEREARKAADQRAKAAETLLAEQTAAVEALKSKQADELKAKDQKIAGLTTDLARSQVIHEKKIPDALAEFLRGNTREELAESADKLLAALPTTGGDSDEKADEPLRMRPDPTQGGAQATTPDVDPIAAALAAAVGGTV